jgi:hypothetical protein
VALAVPPQPEVAAPPSDEPVSSSPTTPVEEGTNAVPVAFTAPFANKLDVGLSHGLDAVDLLDIDGTDWQGYYTLQRDGSLRSSHGEIEGSLGYQLGIVERTNPDGDHELRLEKKIPDQEFAAGSRFIRYLIPVDTFVHTDVEAKVALSAFMIDGTPLPTWLNFDGEKGEFSGLPPESFYGELLIKVVARDDDGRQAETIVRLRVVEKIERLSLTGKPSLTDQLRSAGLFARQTERDQLIRNAREAGIQAEATKNT